jgi:hypothetical protein
MTDFSKKCTCYVFSRNNGGVLIVPFLERKKKHSMCTNVYVLRLRELNSVGRDNA